MALNAVLNSRPAGEEDRARLANLLHFETYVHRHLDWRRPIDWLGKQPYLVLESGDRLTAALACPSDPEGVAWLRLFATTTRVEPQAAWDTLWPQAMEQLNEMNVHHVAALPLQEWFRQILVSSEFAHTHNVVVMDWPADDVPEPKVKMRPMTRDDLPSVVETDRAAFAPLWQNSLEAVKVAFDLAALASVVEKDGRIAAFQISTPATQGFHLARLATHPDFQGQGFAVALVHELQREATRRSKALVTVNTQDNNKPSLALYKKLGFRPTGELFPVFEHTIN